MRNRSLGFALTRPKVLLPGLFGLGLLLGKLSMFWGLGFVAFALMQASKLLSHTELDDLLRLKEQKKRHGIRRLLTPAERHEIITLDEYAESLRRDGADHALTTETMDRAWRIIEEGGNRDTAGALRAFRLGLPSLEGGAPALQTPLGAKIAREISILRATRKEIQSVGQVTV